jgi:DNA ligase-1
MSENLPEDFDKSKLTYYVFDVVDDNLQAQHRFIVAEQACIQAQEMGMNVVFVEQTPVYDAEELAEYEAKALAEGYEGVMLKSLTGAYKHGRATESSQDLLKVKQFTDAEAEITGVEELMHNNNEAKKNELGHTERSSHKENLVGMDTLGALVCKTPDGVVFKIGTGYDAVTRKHLWEKRDILIGQLAKYKSFLIGVVEKPRLPVFIGIRSRDDL